MKRPWMPLYVGDYLGDTGHLTTTQHGAYLLLMMFYWRAGRLPNDDKQLSKITGLSPKTWLAYRPVIAGFFYEADSDPWRHKRIDAELREMQELSDRRSAAGYKAGIASALARMRREKPYESWKIPATATRKPLISNDVTQPIVDHSHSYSKKEGVRQVRASPELLATLTKGSR